jgi:peroxiredoxin Q/BCP
MMSSSQLEVGHAAPPFALADQDGHEITLKSLAGRWVVLYFYPKDDTPGCTTEACEFTDGIQDFRDLNAVVYGCSPDSPESHLKFIEKHSLEVGLLSDPTHGVMEAYGAWGEKNMYGKVTVGAIRSTVIINPDGVVAHRWKRAGAKGHAAKVKQKLEQLQG